MPIRFHGNRLIRVERATSATLDPGAAAARAVAAPIPEALLRKAAERTVDRLWSAIGRMIQTDGIPL